MAGTIPPTLQGPAARASAAADPEMSLELRHNLAENAVAAALRTAADAAAAAAEMR